MTLISLLPSMAIHKKIVLGYFWSIKGEVRLIIKAILEMSSAEWQKKGKKDMGNSKVPPEGLGPAGCEGLGRESSRAWLTWVCLHAATFV